MSSFAQRTSALESAEARFLSTCLSDSLDSGWLTPADLCEEFPPELLMMALQQAPELRARLLVDATGVHERVALRKSTGTAAEDLRLALDEGLCDPDRLLEIVTVDEWVRYLDPRRLWVLITRDQFWLDNGPRAQERMSQILQASIDQRLLEFSVLLRAASPERLAADLPRELVEEVMVRALNAGLEGQRFELDAFAALIPVRAWLQHIPLIHFWESVISEVVVPRAGLAPVKSSPPPRAALAPPRLPASTQGKARKSKTRSKQMNAGTSPGVMSLNSGTSRAAMSPEETQARSRAIHLLKQLDRVPPSVDELSTPALLGLETMYTELPKARTDAEKEECIIDAFPNEHLLEEALLPMAVLLDPRLTVDELVRRGADAGSLIALLLFEERRRVNRSQSIPPAAPSAALPTAAHHSSRAAAAPQGLPPSPHLPRLSDSVPPPPPTSGVSRAVHSSSVPPPPPSQRASYLPPPLPRQYRTGN